MNIWKNQVFKVIDQDGDGRIDFEEFYSATLDP